MTATLWIMVALIALIIWTIVVALVFFRSGVQAGSSTVADQAALLEIMAATNSMLMRNSRGQWIVSTEQGKILVAGKDPLDALRGLREHYHQRLPDPRGHMPPMP